MFDDKKISAIIPCLNEERGVRETLAKRPSCVDEVIVIDNGSTDDTAGEARRSGATVVYEARRGYGRAIQAGLAAASGDIMVLLDGDATYPITEINTLLGSMKRGGYAFMVGCRYPLAHTKVQPFLSTAANFLFSSLVRVAFGIDLQDSQSGMMAFTRDVLDKVLPASNDMRFSQEIKIRAYLNRGIRCGETHISYCPRVGTTKFRMIRDSVNALASLFSLWREAGRRTA